MPKDWENAYKQQGEIQDKVDSLVEESLSILKQRKVKKILDVSFGTGRHTIFLAENGFEMYGIDTSSTGKQITEKKAKEKNLKNIHLQIADMHDLPYQDIFFNAVLAIYTLEHNTLADLKKAVAEIERVLKNKGILVTGLLSNKDLRYGTGEELEPNTFINQEDPTDSDLPHHFSDKKEFKEIFSNFQFVKLEEKIGWSERRQAQCAHWRLIGEKN